ncbi:MAG: DUF1588 domain-containing protein [Planctomycetota bacterium]
MKFTFIAPLFIVTRLAFGADAKSLDSEFETDIRPALVRLCGDCHNKDKDVPFLKTVALRDMNSQRGVWRSTVDQLRNRTMPPKEEKAQPTEAERLRLSTWLESTLRQTAIAMPDYAGAPISRRLDRIEYDNSIRDLFGLDLNFSETFPTEGSGGEGFSNNGETLFLPAILMERYLESAQQILDSAIITPPLRLSFSPNEFAPVPRTVSGKEGYDDAALKRLKSALASGKLDKDDEAVVSVAILVTGDYEFSLTATTPEKPDAVLGLKIDGIAAAKFKLTNTVPEKPATAIIRLQRGVHTLSIGSTTAPSVMSKLALNEKQPVVKESKRDSHRRIFGQKDAVAFAALTPDARRSEAQSILSILIIKAFRRALNPGELERFMALYDRAAKRNDPFEESIKLALKAVLVSPHFLFRTETDYEKPGIYPLNDFELASRLSYFLWASMPDDELLKLASAKKLNASETLAAQIERMLNVKNSSKQTSGSDLKSYAFIEDFTGQWLGTKEVGASVAFTNEKYKGVYTSDLADDLRAEPIHMMDFIVAENRSLLELIDGNYIFATSITAKHYDIPNVSSRQFQKIDVSNGRRGGLLGLGAVHMITSYPDRTSPVLRGAWVLETMLGVKVPNPPPDIPPLSAAKKKQKDATLRAALELHRANAVCATCHNLIDPIGFGLENFDLLGRWRDTDANKPIDSSGIMPTGETFNGPAELKKVLLARKGEFARHITSKMLGYALGRSLDDRDDVTIEKIAAALEKDNFRARTLIKEIVLSTPFRNRQGGEPPKKNAPVKKKELPAAKEK